MKFHNGLFVFIISRWQNWLLHCQDKQGIDIAKFLEFYSFCVKKEVDNSAEIQVEITDFEAMKFFVSC
jgi:hypothetical protein